MKKIFEGKKAVPYITLGESPTSTANQVVISSNTFAVPAPEHGHRQTPPVDFPQPSAILEEHPGSDYNKFIGNVIQGRVTTVTLVGEHSSKD